MPVGRGPAIPVVMTALGTVTDGSAGIPGAKLRAKRGDYWVGTETGPDGRWAFPFSLFDVVLVSAPGYAQQMFGPATLPHRVTMRRSEGPVFVPTPDPPAPSGPSKFWLIAGAALVALASLRS